MDIRFILFLNSANLICRGTDISKCFRESRGIRDNEGRLYVWTEKKIILSRAIVRVRLWVGWGLFVCAEVLGPSQPNGVMSSAACLPNHTFTGQA